MRPSGTLAQGRTRGACPALSQSPASALRGRQSLPGMLPTGVRWALEAGGDSGAGGQQDRGAQGSRGPRAVG